MSYNVTISKTNEVSIFPEGDDVAAIFQPFDPATGEPFADKAAAQAFADKELESLAQVWPVVSEVV